MSSRKIVIVGGVAGGAACATRLRRLDESAEIFIYERGPAISYAICGLPYYVGGVINRREQLMVASPESFRDNFNVEVRVRHQVEGINRTDKTVLVRNLSTGETFEQNYDCLVLATGSTPVRPNLPGMNLPGVFTLHHLEEADQMMRFLQERPVRQAVVVGAGYVGLEMVENLVRREIEVTLLEQMPHVLPQMDPEMVAPIHQALCDHGVHLAFNAALTGVEQGSNRTLYAVGSDGKRHRADMVVVGVGVRPEVSLARMFGLEIGELGGIRVDEQMRTSDPAIWAVGDAVEVRDFITGQWTLVPLAGPAGRQARVAAESICGRPTRYRGVQGTAIVGVFETVAACTGATEKRLRQVGMRYAKSFSFSMDRASYYPGAHRIAMKLLFDPETGRILGAQAVGKDGVARRMDVIAFAIQKHATVYDLEEAELAYAPQFGTARDPINIAGSVAANVARGDMLPAYWEDYLPEMIERGQILAIDVRSPTDYRARAVPGTVNIPLGELRARLNELPKDREIWVHCGVGQRAYYATRILLQNGFRARNLLGGITLYSAVKGQAQKPQ